MAIFLNILFLLIGLVLLIKGADFFVDGASGIAKKFRISPLIIGLTVVAMGTSLPELAVGVVSSIRGSNDLAVGNVIGSNIFNILMILGISAIILPISIKKTSRKIDIPFMLLSGLVLFVFAADSIFDNASGNVVSRAESIVLLILLAVYMYVTINTIVINRKDEKFVSEPMFSINPPDENAVITVDELVQDSQKKISVLKKEAKELPAIEEPVKKKYLDNIWVLLVLLIVGTAGVIAGGEFVSSTAKFLALKLGMSESLVGLTVVAMGTSLPELVTSVVAIKKKQVDIGLGNIIGSCIFNCCLILGLVGTVNPMAISQHLFIDMAIMLVSMFLLAISCWKRNHMITRAEGIMYVCCYAAYLTYIIIRN